MATEHCRQALGADDQTVTIPLNRTMGLSPTSHLNGTQ